MATFLPSMNPASFRPCRKASTIYAKPAACVLLRNPITGSAGCCALAASGHAAAPPRSAMNWRRVIRSPRCLPQRGNFHSAYAGVFDGALHQSGGLSFLHKLAYVGEPAGLVLSNRHRENERAVTVFQHPRAAHLIGIQQEQRTG